VGARLRRPGIALLSCGAISVTALAGCGGKAPSDPLRGVPSALVLEARPIGSGPRFHPPAKGPVLGACDRGIGRRFGVHVELFAANRVVLVAQGIGTRPPRHFSGGRISGARCYGDLVTIDPTGLVLIRSGLHLTMADLFRSWGQPLSERRLLSFAVPRGTRVTVFIDGHPSSLAPGQVPLARHAELVLEVGPHVPPHASYTFPPGS
jgi:hypothetical protein